MIVLEQQPGTAAPFGGHDEACFFSSVVDDSDRPTVMSVLRCHAPVVWQAFPARLSAHKSYVLRQITLCRQPAMGTHAWHCDWCGNTQVSYNGCHNRCCPNCHRRKRVEWVERILQWALPIDYLHCVFTLPHEFIPWILANEDALYRVLFTAVSETLSQLASEQHGVRLGFVMVLHSWGQRMNSHVHCHVVVTAGGLALDETHWMALTKKDTVFSEAVLGERFRRQFLRGLRLRFRQQKLTTPRSASWVTDEATLDRWLEPVLAKDWHVHVQAAPPEYQGPAAVLNYLAGYVVGTAIRDDRILSHDGRHVVIRVKNYRTGQYEECSMTGEQFVERFALHILPRRLLRVRFVGLFSPNRRRDRLAICRRLLGVELPEDNSADEVGDEVPEELPNDLAGDSDMAAIPSPAVPDCQRCGMPGMRLEAVRTPWETKFFLTRLRGLCDLVFACISTFELGPPPESTLFSVSVVRGPFEMPAAEPELLVKALYVATFTTSLDTAPSIPLPDT